MYSYLFPVVEKWLDTLDELGISIRFKEDSVLVTQADDVCRNIILKYEKFSGRTTRERFEEILEAVGEQQRQQEMKSKVVPLTPEEQEQRDRLIKCQQEYDYRIQAIKRGK